MDLVTKQCEICGRLKGETNHWLLAVTAAPDSGIPGKVGIAFGPFDSAVDDPALKVGHLCSHACAAKYFSQWLGTL